MNQLVEDASNSEINPLLVVARRGGYAGLVSLDNASAVNPTFFEALQKSEEDEETSHDLVSYLQRRFKERIGISSKAVDIILYIKTQLHLLYLQSK